MLFWPAPKFAAHALSLLENADRAAEAVAQGSAALLTSKMSEEDCKKRGAVEPWEAAPASDTPSMRKARAILAERRGTIAVRW